MATYAYGALAEQYAYHPYGEYLATENGSGGSITTPTVPFGHQGLWFNEETGIYHNRHRDYNPDLQRFMQRDPNETGMVLAGVMRLNATNGAVGAKLAPGGQYGDGLSLYLYVGSNPLGGSDPTGLDIWDEVEDITAEIWAGRVDNYYEVVIQARMLAQIGQQMAREMAEGMAMEGLAAAIYPPSTYAFDLYYLYLGIREMYEHGVSWPGMFDVFMNVAGIHASANSGMRYGLDVRGGRAGFKLKKLQLRRSGKRASRRTLQRGYKGGSHRLVSGNGKNGHHIPAWNSWEQAKGEGNAPHATYGSAPAVSLEIADHKMTTSNGSGRKAVKWRKDQAKLLRQGRGRDAMLMDINDIQNRFPGKYDAALLETLEYAEKYFRR